jgi:ABC-2 type transport system permease protein
MEREKITKIIIEGFHDLFHIWKEEFKHALRDSGAMIFFFIVPLTYPLIYSSIYNPETTHKVKVVAVDNSNSAYSREFIRRMNATPDVQITTVCASMDEAKTMLNKKEAYGILAFPSEFSKNIHLGKQATVSLYCDMSLLLYYKAMLLSATEVSLEMNKEVSVHKQFQSTDTFSEIQINPVLYEAITLFNPSNGFASFLLPGVLMLVIQQTLILGIGMLAGTTREAHRSHPLAPENARSHGILRVVTGKSLTYLIIYVVVCFWTLFVVPKLFSFPNAGGTATLFLFLLPYLSACIFFAMTLSGFMHTRESSMMIFVFLSVIFLFISGISWPKEAFPVYWRILSNVFPSTPGINGYVLIKSCGATLNEVAHEYYLLWLQTGVYFITACLVYRRKMTRVKKKPVA